jgi:hypothetical protein
LQGLKYAQEVLGECGECDGCTEMRKTTGRENKPDLFILDTSANAECQ